MRSKKDIEIETAKHILVAMANEIERLERYWPPAKRGSNAQASLDGIKDRRAVALQCLIDAECAA